MLTSLLPLPVAQDFDASQYFSINVSLAAQQQYGSSATVVQVSSHLYGWRAVVGGRQYSIDMQRAVRDQFGAGYILGAVGVGIYDWRAVHWSALSQYPNSFVVVPVMPIASDFFFDVASVSSGLANFKSVLVATRNWYALREGKTFRMLQPLVVFNQFPMTSTQWNSYSATDAYAFQDFAWNAYISVYPDPTLLSTGEYAQRVVIAPFTGNSISQFGGSGTWNAIASSPPFRAVYAIAAPVASSVSCPATFTNPQDFHCSAAEYDIGHWLGVTFGLADCVTNPTLNECANSGGSIMQVAQPWLAGLTAIEVTKLGDSPFFYPLATR
jgi:hypothetical protein